VKDFVWGP
jgi:ribonuclease HI